jgi:hypothetical protein
MKLTTQKLKKLIQEELNEMAGGPMSSHSADDSMLIEQALESVSSLLAKFNFKTDPELAKLLSDAEMALGKASYIMRGRDGTRPDDELDIY